VSYTFNVTSLENKAKIERKKERKKERLDVGRENELWNFKTK